MVRGQSGPTIKSPFLREIPNASVEIHDRTKMMRVTRPTRTWEEDQRIGDDDDSHEPQVSCEFRRGQLVRHPKFGLGRIAEISGYGDNTKVDVQFNSAGRKTLILQYAKLEAVG
jgi:DNA helicase-2/ATP-dependent DNA helicase PcrA